MTHQAVQLGFLPRLRTEHTSARAAGQIYIPAVNWGLLVMVILLVLGFRQSTNLASAYGIAVSGTMIITTIMLAVLIFQVWKWNRWLAALTIGVFALVDGSFFASNLAKVADGGWFPLVVAAIIFTVLTTWATGRRADARESGKGFHPARGVHQVGGHVGAPGDAGRRFSCPRQPTSIPSALLHNLKHNQVLHERVLILTVQGRGCAACRPGKAARTCMMRVTASIASSSTTASWTRSTFPDDLARIEVLRRRLRHDEHELLPRPAKAGCRARSTAGMALWREKLFAWMMRSSESAMEFFKLPTNRVVELGSQLRI